MIAALDSLLWNQLLVAVAAALLWVICSFRFLRQRPALRHALWLLLLLKMVTPAVVSIPILPNDSGRQDSVYSVAAVVPEPVRLTVRDSVVDTESAARRQSAGHVSDARVSAPTLIALTVVSISLVVTAGLWLVAIRQVRRLRRLSVASLRPSQRGTAALQAVADRFGLTELPALLMVTGTCSPMLWVDGRRAWIFLPQELADSSTDEQLRQILAHELAHVVRHDHLCGWLAFLVTSICWWNPLAWLARREMLLAAETSCDALAIERLAGSRRTYATTLVEASDFVSRNKSVPPLLVVSFGESHSLRRRIEMIADVRVRSSLSERGRFAVIGIGLLALLLVPVQAQDVSDESSDNAPAAVGATEPVAETSQEVADTKQATSKPQTESQSEAETEPQTETTAETKLPAEGDDDQLAGANTALSNQPRIRNARLVSWGGADQSCRAYFFETKLAADSFAQTIAAFGIAERIQVNISADDRLLFDHGGRTLTIRPNHAQQLGLDSDNYVLLWGSRDQHARVEAVIVALGAE